MSFFQRVGNAMARFMYGRNGGDRLGLVTIWTAVVIDVVCLFIKGYQVPYLILSTLSTAMVLWALWRPPLWTLWQPPAQFVSAALWRSVLSPRQADKSRLPGAYAVTRRRAVH